VGEIDYDNRIIVRLNKVTNKPWIVTPMPDPKPKVEYVIGGSKSTNEIKSSNVEISESEVMTESKTSEKDETSV